MGRGQEKDRLREPMLKCANMIADALSAGQRPDGKVKPWTDDEFAKAVGVSLYTVKDWRNRTMPNRPKTHVGKILGAFYGTNPAFAEKRAALYDALIAAGCEPDDPPEPGHIPLARQFSDVFQIASLQLNREEPINKDGTIEVPFTLRFLNASKVEVRLKDKGKLVSRTVDFSLDRPLFLVSSKYWQPVQASFFRKGAIRKEAGQKYYQLSLEGEDCVEITGPKAPDGRIMGDPFPDEDDYIVKMETRAAAGNGPIEFTVEVPAERLHVTLSGEPMSPLQADVVNAILGSKIPRGKKSKERLVIASASMTPGVQKSSA